MSNSLGRSNNIKKMMDAITKIDIGMTTVLKHGFCSLGKFVEVRMAGFVIGGAISFSSPFCRDIAYCLCELRMLYYHCIIEFSGAT